MTRLIEEFRSDLAYALRRLRVSPGFGLAAVLTLALGIGATSAVFSVVNGVLIKPLPYPDSDALVSVTHLINGRPERFFGDTIYVTYAENAQTFQEFGVWSPYVGTATVTGTGDPDEVRVLAASHGLLRALGVRPEIGRWFSQADDIPGAPDTVILTQTYWRSRFGGDAAVTGRTLTINARPFQIIGVMPAGFRFAGDREIIVPLRINPARPVPAFRLLGVARLKPEITLEQANADVGRMIAIWRPRVATGVFSNTRYQTGLRPLKEDVVGDVGRMLWLLLGAIGVVLLMACANVANLMLVRVNARARELAIRAALGARWTRIGRELLVESLTLALLGGVMGLAIAYGGLRVLVAIGPSNLPRLAEISIDRAVLGFTVAIALVSGVLFSLLPIVKCARPPLMAAMAAASRGGGHAREHLRYQNVLVVAQIALALVLLVSGGLMIRTFQALRSVEPGFVQPNHVETFSLSIPPADVPDPQVERIEQEILDRIAAVPGVASAAFTTRLPMDTSPRTSFPVTVEGRLDAGGPPISRQTRFVSPGLFRTLGTPLIVGREFTWSDVHDSREVVMISATLAREIWGSPAAALGKRIRHGDVGSWREIVGVTEDVYDEGVHRRATALVFFPARSHANVLGLPGYQPRRINVVVRSERTGTGGLLDDVTAAVRSVNPNWPLAEIRTLKDVYDASLAPTSFALVLLAAAGAMALGLGICGLYGVMAYAVSRRRREIGIRMALGARARDIRGLFVRRGILLAGIGAAIGLGAAAGFARMMRTLVFGISPLDPITFAAMPVVLAAAAVLASYLPARRAAAVDPVETLRAD